MAEPHVSPPPKPVIINLSFSFIYPISDNSAKAIGILAAEVLPYLSIFIKNLSMGIFIFLDIISTILLFA